jgi:hypothetical protein
MPESKNVVKYILLRHVTVDIGYADAHSNMGKYRNVPYVTSEGYEASRCEVDISGIRVLKLPDELEYVQPERHPDMDEDYWKEWVNEAVRESIKARSAHSGLRKKILHHAKNGTIKVVADPNGFLGQPFDNSEVAAAEEAAEAAAQVAAPAPVLEAPDVLNAMGKNRRRPKARQ